MKNINNYHTDKEIKIFINVLESIVRNKQHGECILNDNHFTIYFDSVGIGDLRPFIPAKDIIDKFKEYMDAMSCCNCIDYDTWERMKIDREKYKELFEEEDD